MKMTEVTMVRIYLSEKGGQLDNLIKRLHDWEKVRGVSVFRAITGYGENGKVHTTSFTALSLDLPLVVEFFDEPGKVEKIIEHLNDTVKPRHIVKWNVWVNKSEE